MIKRLALLCLVLSTPASAQGITDLVKRARSQHTDCFYNSAAAQITAIEPNLRRMADINLIAEQSFLACATEEQMLIRVIRTAISEPSAIQIAVLGNRTNLKNELNNIFRHPERYK